MSSRSTFTITLSEHDAARVEAKVATDGYSDGAEVIREGLRRLLSHDSEVELWLRTDVAATYDAHMRDPSRAITAEQVLTNLDNRVAEARASREP